jgi:hypothetical protein
MDSDNEDGYHNGDNSVQFSLVLNQQPIGQLET